MPFICTSCYEGSPCVPFYFPATRSPYPRDRNYSFIGRGIFWHTSVMFFASTGVAVRAHIALDVFLRLTRMDVCCGPPYLN